MKTLDMPVLDRLLDPLGRILTPDVARKLANYRFDAKAQAHIATLARKCNEGKLSDRERSEYETYVNVIDIIAILQAKARARLKRVARIDGKICTGTGAPAGSLPLRVLSSSRCCRSCFHVPY